MKKILSLLMVVCLAVYVTGCGTSDDSADSSTQDLGNAAEMPGEMMGGDGAGDPEEPAGDPEEKDAADKGEAEKENADKGAEEKDSADKGDGDN